MRVQEHPVDTRRFCLFDLLEWMERVLDNRSFHLDEWYMLFATEERYVGFTITEQEIWAGGVTNYNLSDDQKLTHADEMRLAVLGWTPEDIGSIEPNYVRRWSPDAPTEKIVSGVLRVFTSVYLPTNGEVVEVVRGTVAQGNVGWDSAV